MTLDDLPDAPPFVQTSRGGKPLSVAMGVEYFKWLISFLDEDCNCSFALNNHDHCIQEIERLKMWAKELKS